MNEYLRAIMFVAAMVAGTAMVWRLFTMMTSLASASPDTAPGSTGTRRVFLVDDDGEIEGEWAEPTESGWAVQMGDETWIILNPDGTITGASDYARWMPRSGWAKDHAEAAKAIDAEL